MFGALSYTVASMLNSGDTQYINEERADLYAGEILDYTRKVRETVQFLKISNDCDDTEISFENNFVSGYEHSPATRDECKVFHSDGGGLSYLEPDEKWLDTAYSSGSTFQKWHFPRGTCIFGVGDDGTNTSDCNDSTSDNLNEDLIITLPHLRLEVCEQINKVFSVNNPPPQETTCAIGPFQFSGVYSGTCEIGDSASALIGKQSACLQQDEAGITDADNSYIVYHTLIVR